MSDHSQEPLVSICTITYNHAPFIAQCLDGILMQKTRFPFEIIVHDDASTDGTNEIVREYAEKYPQIIVPILQRENQWSRGIAVSNTFVLPKVRGKYIALCEGDDYWHDPDKLQRQVDILEENPDVSLVATDVDVLHVKTGRKISSVMKRTGQLDLLAGISDMTTALMRRELNIVTCSVCVRSQQYLQMRNSCTAEFLGRFKMGDVQSWWELSRMGKVVVIPESMATYRVMVESASHSEDGFKIFEFYENSLDLHEHYVHKFGYGQELLDFVRKAHFGILMESALRCRDDELRRRVCELCPLDTPGLDDIHAKLLKYTARHPVVFRLMASIFPLWKLWFRAHQRVVYLMKKFVWKCSSLMMPGKRR